MRRAEIYFADSAKAMVERSDWVVPYFRGEPFFDKPALTYWGMTLPFEAVGPTVGAARFSSAVSALLVILLTVYLGRVLWRDTPSSLAAGWVLTGTLAFMMFGRTAMSDMEMTLFSTLAFAIAAAWSYEGLSDWWAVVLFSATLGLGFMTKGPIAVLVPLLALPGLLWSARRTRPLPSVLSLLPGIPVFLCLAFGWFFVVYLRLGTPPLEHFFIRENLQRFSGAAHDVGRPVWFYLVTYLGQGAPWSLFLPFALVHLLRRRADSRAAVLAVWVGLVALLLTASRGKLDYYLLPLYPPLALLLGRYLATVRWGRLERSAATFVLALMGLVFAALPLALLRVPEGWRPHSFELGLVSLGLWAVAVFCLSALRSVAPAAFLKASVAGLCVVFLVLNVSILPAFYQGQPNALFRGDINRERATTPEITVATNDDPLQFHRDLLFEDRLILQESPDLQVLAQSDRPYLFLVNAPVATALQKLPKIRKVSSYPYLPSRALTLRGIRAGMSPDEMVLLANFGS